jgi:protein-L-isoaspartate(D-aspartate) O-methyltransferase
MQPMTMPTDWSELRERMVRDQLRARGVHDPRVLAAMATVPRHEFVPAALVERAYEDSPLPIGHGQTISQPYVVALMAELAAPDPGSRVLEIGTGCGYQAAVLAVLAREVVTIEIVASLAREAAERLAALGYANVRVRHGDGHRGAPDVAPFDAILVAAAPEHVPAALLDQLAPGGRLVLPVGLAEQELRVYRRTADGIVMEHVCPVSFVPMTGAPSAR